MMENPIKVDALGVPLFLETPISRFLAHVLLKDAGNLTYNNGISRFQIENLPSTVHKLWIAPLSTLLPCQMF